jgi:hypothetical protein
MHDALDLDPLAVLAAGQQLVERFEGSAGQGRMAEDMDRRILDSRREIRRCGVAVDHYQAAGVDPRVRVFDPQKYAGAVVLEEIHPVFRCAVGNRSAEVDRVLPRGLGKGEGADLGYAGQDAPAPGGGWLAPSGNRQHQERKHPEGGAGGLSA